jgi:hypothetical protein
MTSCVKNLKRPASKARALAWLAGDLGVRIQQTDATKQALREKPRRRRTVMDEARARAFAEAKRANVDIRNSMGMINERARAIAEQELGYTPGRSGPTRKSNLPTGRQALARVPKVKTPRPRKTKAKTKAKGKGKVRAPKTPPGSFRGQSATVFTTQAPKKLTDRELEAVLGADFFGDEFVGGPPLPAGGGVKRTRSQVSSGGSFFAPSLKRGPQAKTRALPRAGGTPSKKRVPAPRDSRGRFIRT